MFRRSVTAGVEVLSRGYCNKTSSAMRLLQFLRDGKSFVGVETAPGGDIVDLSQVKPALPSDMRSFIEGGQASIQAAQRQLLNVERSAEECRKQYSNCKDKAKEKNDAIRRPKTGGGPKPPSPTLPEQMILDDHSESAVFFGVQNGYDTEEVIPTGDAPLSAQQQEVESANTAMLTSLPSDVVNVYVGEDGILGTSAKEGTYPRRKSCKRARGDVEAAEIATLLAEKEKFVEEKKYFQAKTALVQLQIKKLQAEMEGTSTAPVLSYAVDSGQYKVPRSEVKVTAPIFNPDKVLCIGMNYKDHCEEQGAPVPEVPVIFNKFPSCIIGPTDDLHFPEETQQLDWEVELTIVIGKEAKKVKESEGMDYIYGYTVAHDVSARDWQLGAGRNGGQWVIGKAMDDFCPLGPVIVTKEGIKDPHNLALRCLVNGVVKQDSNTNQLVHRSAAMVAFISRFMTLKPGDLILTGTPPGVGVFRKPPEFLKRGDVVECEIEGIGSVVNKVV